MKKIHLCLWLGILFLCTACFGGKTDHTAGSSESVRYVTFRGERDRRSARSDELPRPVIGSALPEGVTAQAQQSESVTEISSQVSEEQTAEVGGVQETPLTEARVTLILPVYPPSERSTEPPIVRTGESDSPETGNAAPAETDSAAETDGETGAMAETEAAVMTEAATEPETAETKETSAEMEPDETLRPHMEGNSGQIFLYSEYGGEKEALAAANSWAENALFKDQESPWHYSQGYKGWTLWTIEDSSLKPAAWTVQFYR